MLRKRTSFKPNLKQVTSQQASTPDPKSNDTVSATQVPAGSADAAFNQPGNADKTKEKVIILEQQPDSSTSNQCKQSSNHLEPLAQSLQPDDQIAGTSNINPTSPTKAVKNQDISNKKVQEAITQLTGQKLEPIKSLNLRSSANKDVKLKDLLFFNPPMTKDQRRHKKSINLAKKNEQKRIHEEEKNKKDNQDVEQDATIPDEPSLVPKVKMGPDGRLILDESSMIINRKNAIKEQEAIVEDNEDIISRTNYDSFRRRPTATSQSKWSIDDTNKFYHALTILGTDFSMMESLLFSGQRSRTELHKKFKREERVNKLKIDIALSNRISLDSEELLMCTTPDRSGQALI